MATSRRHSVSTFTPFLDHGVYSTPARPVATPSPMEAVYKEQSARLAQENKTLQVCRGCVCASKGPMQPRLWDSVDCVARVLRRWT